MKTIAQTPSLGQVRARQGHRHAVRGPHPLFIGGLPSQLWLHPKDVVRGPRSHRRASKFDGSRRRFQLSSALQRILWGVGVHLFVLVHAGEHIILYQLRQGPSSTCPGRDLMLPAPCVYAVQVLMQEPVQPMSFLRVKPIGVMQMLDQGEQDDKVIAVHWDDPEFKHFNVGICAASVLKA